MKFINAAGATMDVCVINGVRSHDRRQDSHCIKINHKKTTLTFAKEGLPPHDTLDASADASSVS